MSDSSETYGRIAFFAIAVAFVAIAVAATHQQLETILLWAERGGLYRRFAALVSVVVVSILALFLFITLRLAGVISEVDTDTVSYVSVVLAEGVALFAILILRNPPLEKVVPTLASGLVLALANVLFLDGVVWRYVHRSSIGTEYRTDVSRLLGTLERPYVSALSYVGAYLIVFNVVNSITSSSPWILTLTLAGGVVIGETVLHVFFSDTRKNTPKGRLRENTVEMLILEQFGEDSNRVPKTDTELREELPPFSSPVIEQGMCTLQTEGILSSRELPDGTILWYSR